MDFLPYTPNDAEAHVVSVNDEIPRNELDLFFRDEAQFLPPGKTWSDLSPEELKIVRDRYRFDPLKPGMYQGITGIGTTGGIPKPPPEEVDSPTKPLI